MAKSDSLTGTRAGHFASQVMLGLALIAVGVLLLDYAVDSMTVGRPITRAWVAGVAGLMLLVPGLAVAALAFFSAFTDSKNKRGGSNGPAPFKFI